mgnify:CR=1 FL=1
METCFIGNYYEYELNSGVVTKYYYSGGQRIAVRSNGTLHYMFSDRLGSTSLVTFENGNPLSELRYKPWGEVRYASGNTPTQYQYTSQYSYESDFGLYFYQSRFYDPSIGRFSSPDTIIPLGQGVQAWDRYAYSNNNPVRYNDPSGHCAILCAVVLTVAIVATPFALSAFGVTPDYIGVDIARAATGGSGDAVVAAGIAVQSQYPWAIVGGDARGFAQALDEEIENGQNPYSPSDAVAIMDERINEVVDACTRCKSPTDNLIVAALAQNYPGFNKNSVTYLPIEDGQIDWVDVMTNPDFNNPQAIDAKLRQSITGMNYETRLMLKIYMQDLKVLMKLGYQLPDKYVGADFEYINNLIANPHGQQTPQ